MKQLNLRELESELREVASPAEVAGLLKLAESISTIPQPGRSQEARSATREQVLAGADSAAERRSPWFGGWVFALAPALAAVAILVLVTTAGSAAPGQPLYGVKRLTEDAQLAVALTPAAKAEHCSANMRRRAEELASLAPGQSAATVAGLAADIATEAQEFSEFARASGDQAARLKLLQSSDANYVVSKLEAAERNQSGADQQSTITSLLKTMRALAHPTA